jgi:hypothetical protein
VPIDDEPDAAMALTGVDPAVPISLGDTEVVTAWGLCDDEPPADRHTWRSAWAHAVAFLLCGALLAAVIGACAWAWMQMNGDDHAPPATQPVLAPPYTVAAPEPSTATPTPAAEPPPTVIVQAAPTTTVTVQAPPPSLERFALLPTIGNGWTEGQLAISTCNVMWDGGTKADAVQFVQRISGWGFEQASRWTADATAAECPTVGR